MNRLTGISLNGVSVGSSTYDVFGRMTNKTKDEQLVFTTDQNSFDPTNKPHALRSVYANQGVFSEETQIIEYTPFDKVRYITEGENTLTYKYGFDHQRIKMTETVNGISRQKLYLDNCEVAITDNNREELTFISGPIGVFAVVETDGNNSAIHYIHKDHLGSWTTITNDNGQVEQEVSFDAWGNLRDPDTWLHNWYNPALEEPMFDRGYTGHEHLYAFGLINMNGRCYDPVMSSFLSVDAFVQSPDNSQSFNRYAYCMNNPLKYTDPSGWVMLGGMTPNNPFHDNWGQNFGEKIYTATEVRQMLWTTDISIGIWMVGNEMHGTRGESSNYAGFFDENGNYLGSDGRKNGKVYVIRSEIPEAMAKKDEILRFFNEGVSSLTINEIYGCFVEILPSRLARNRMYDIVSQDDGNGGSAECNNREYGGYIDEYGFPIETQHGDVKSPCIDKNITINFPYGMKYATFHSHPSGIGNCENYIGEDGKPYMPIWQQSPTKDDFNVAGNHICYVFGRRNDCVYVYTRQGVQTIISTSAFISNSKFIKP